MNSNYYEEKVGNSMFFYDRPRNESYEFYYLELVKNFFLGIQKSFNVIFGPVAPPIQNNNPIIRTDFQIEHTLVKTGGRGVIYPIWGKIPTDDGQFYHVRIQNYNFFNNLDLIIEYSYPNFQNIEQSGYFQEYLKKVCVIEPAYLDLNLDSQSRESFVTLENTSPRRDIIHHKLNDLGLNPLRITGCGSDECIKKLYSTTKLILNTHQTDHHHTFEELRVLPALSQGVLVISEDVPLKEFIPYHQFVLWCDYERIPEFTKEVLDNYEHYYQKVFSQDFASVYSKMREDNVTNLNRHLDNLVDSFSTK
jgi:hypothetical protein